MTTAPPSSSLGASSRDASFHLLEALAGAIADALLATFAVDEVEVRVRKPKAPLPGAFETVEVRLRRRRDGVTG